MVGCGREREFAPDDSDRVAREALTDEASGASGLNGHASSFAASWTRIDDPRTDGWETEVFSARATDQLNKIGALITNAEPIQTQEVRSLLAANFRCDGLLPPLSECYCDEALIVKRMAVPKMRDEISRGQPLEGVDGMVSTLTELQGLLVNTDEKHFKFKLFRVQSFGEHITTQQRFSLSGSAKQRVIQLNATWTARWQLEQSDSLPRLLSLEVDELQQVSTHGSPGNRFLSDCTESALVGNSCYERQLLRGWNHWLERAQDDHYFFILSTPGLAIGDVDGDGLDDLYLCQEGGLPNRLLRQQLDGTLRDVSADSGVDWLENSRSALLVDLDSDGDQDLVVAVLGGVVVAEGNGRGGFSIREVLPSADDVMSLSAADYDQDGRLERQAGQVNGAISYFQDALAVSPDSPATHVQLGHALKEVGRFQEAASEYRRALRISSNAAEIHDSLANALQAMGQLAEAVKHYEQAVRIKPDFAEAHSNWALALEGLGRVEEAVAHYREAIKIRPKSSQTQRLLGQALAALNRLELAQTHLEQAVRLAPDDFDAHAELDKVMIRRKRFAGALSHLESAVRIRPESAAARINLGNVLKIVGRYDEAANAYQQALRINPDSVAAHTNWGLTLEAQGRYDEAIAHFRHALKLDSQLVEAHRHLGRASQKQRNASQAVSHYREYLKRKPNDVQVLNHLALLLATCQDERVRDIGQAVTLAERAAQLTNYSTPIVLDTLAVVHAENGDFKQAVHWQIKAIKLSPNKPSDQQRARLKRYQSERVIQAGSSRKPISE